MQTLTIQTHLKIEYPLTSTPTRLFFFEMVKLQKVEDSWPASQVIKLNDPAWYSLRQATLYVAIYCWTWNTIEYEKVTSSRSSSVVTILSSHHHELHNTGMDGPLCLSDECQPETSWN